MLDLPDSACLWLGDAQDVVPTHALAPHQRCWTAAQVDPASCVVRLDARVRAELATMSEVIR